MSARYLDPTRYADPMLITLLQRDQYGVTVFHPACDKSKLFAAIAGTKTLTRDALKQITLLGYKIRVNHPVGI